MSVNPLLNQHDQATQRYIRRTIDILVRVRGELMTDPNYDLVAATTLWIVINRFVSEGRVLAEAGWSRPGTEGWYQRLQAIQRINQGGQHGG